MVLDNILHCSQNVSVLLYRYIYRNGRTGEDANDNVGGHYY